MGSQSEPHLCLPWGLFTAGKGNPSEAYFHKGEWEEYPGGENLMSCLHELDQRQCACICGGSGYSSHCPSDSPEVLYTASESDLWSGTIIRKQMQVRRMGHVKCKVPATLKPAAEASFGQGVPEVSVISLEQALAGTTIPGEKLWQAKPRNHIAVEIRTGRGMKQKPHNSKRASFYRIEDGPPSWGSQNPVEGFEGTWRLEFPPLHFHPAFDPSNETELLFFFMFHSILYRQPPCFSKMIWLGQQNCQWGRLDGSFPYSGQKIIRTCTSWVLPFQALCPSRHYRFKVDQRPNVQFFLP